jgi:integrase/recombinase XerD
MGALRERMDKDMVLRGMAARTRESYLAALVGLAKHYHKAPDQLAEQEVQDYLFHLINERKLAWSTCNIATNAFKFFYHVTLKQRAVEFCIPRRRPPSKLPEILSREEVTRLIEHTLNLKHRVLLMTTYAAGLRVSEVVHLKITDIDSHRMARHAFATHLLESGVDLHTIQRLLGHGHLSTTLVYFHLAQKDLTATRSPLDLLPDPKPV